MRLSLQTSLNTVAYENHSAAKAGRRKGGMTWIMLIR
nr:MAG TPA: hypothetical protein [Caudoviricetes sp.]